MVSQSQEHQAADPAGLVQALRSERVLAIVRGTDPEASLASVLTLVASGVRTVEVSLSGADALSVLERATAEIGDQALLGAGTVRSGAELQAALDAGARFVVAPSLSPAMTEAAQRKLSGVPGVLTPTEVDRAWAEGWRVLKLFPASLGGPPYLRALKDPYPDVDFVPVGGVTTELAVEYLRVGALAVGIGSPLLGDAPHGGDQTALAKRAKELLARLEEVDR